MSLSEIIKNRYGSKKGLLRYIAYDMLRAFGFYRVLASVDFTKVKRLVFVCQGNICRSPLGEAIARKYGIPAISFGLNTRGDDPADPRAVEWGGANGFDLRRHKTMRVDQYIPEEGDLLIGMEPMHIRQLNSLFSHAPIQITLIGLWFQSPFVYLHDPYNAKMEYFERCEMLVNSAAQSICKHYKK